MMPLFLICSIYIIVAFSDEFDELLIGQTLRQAVEKL
jgi:hypothetical protein